MELTLNQTQILGIVIVLDQFIKAAEKFVAKVDNGQARSVETYTEMKSALAAAAKLKNL